MTDVEILQLGGSVLLLIAFLFCQLSLVDLFSRAYLAANWLGSGLLAVGLAMEGQTSFVIGAIWSLASLASLAYVLTSQGARASIAVSSRTTAPNGKVRDS